MLRILKGSCLSACLILFFVGCKAGQQKPEAISNINAIEKYMYSLADTDAFNGVVLVAEEDELKFFDAIGLADFELGVPLKTEHIFRIGSLTKPITASALLIALDRGDLSLNDTICKYLETCPLSWASVTVHHLLSQSSGIPDLFGELESVPVAETLFELNRVLAGLPQDAGLLFEPGFDYAYSNFNYVLAGAVLEQVTGSLWETVLQESLFKPLGMADTGFDAVFDILPDRINGYDRDDHGSIRNIEYDDHAAYAAGGLRSTADDLFRWSREVFSGNLWNAELHTKAFTAYNDAYGYGWRIRSDFFNQLNYNHTGGIDGFASHIVYYPATQLTIIVLSNIESEPAILRACDIASLYFGDKKTLDIKQLDAMQPRERCGIQAQN